MFQDDQLVENAAWLISVSHRTVHPNMPFTASEGLLRTDVVTVHVDCVCVQP